MGEIIHFFEPNLHPVREKAITELVGQGLLPEDIIFRLMPFGRSPSATPGHSGSTKINIVSEDLVNNFRTPNNFLPETHQILTGPLPPAALDWYNKRYKDLYGNLSEKYYTRGDLGLIIEDRRRYERKSKNGSSRHMATIPSFERSRSLGLATATWRSLVRRLHPEWLENPNPYYEPIITLNQQYNASSRTMRNRIVKATVIADYALYELFQEISDVGIRGIAKVGKEDIRRLLAPEHPELLLGREITIDDLAE